MVACSWSSASPRPGETFTFLRYGARSSMRSRSGVSAYRSSTSIDGLTCVSESITRNPCLIDSRGGPRHGPPTPPTLGARVLSSLPARSFLRQRRLHLPERSVLGRHDVEDDRHGGAAYAVELADEVLDRLDADALTAHRLRDPRVVLAAELRGDEAIAAASLAVLHPAEHAVVQHDRDDGDLVLGRGEQRVHRHGEAAVATHRHAVALGRHELRRHRGRQRVAHAADRGRLIDRPRPAALEVVRHVEAIGAGVHGDHRALTEPACELGDDALRPQRDVVQLLLGYGEVPMQALELRY